MQRTGATPTTYLARFSTQGQRFDSPAVTALEVAGPMTRPGRRSSP